MNRNHHHHHHHQQQEDERHPDITRMDQLIVATAQDAMATKFAAVQAGYYQDPFVRAFYKPSQYSNRRHVQVIIKRGTYARVLTVSRVVESFLEQVTTLESSSSSNSGGSSKKDHPNGVAQVVILGAGQDTAYFRLLFQQHRQQQQQQQQQQNEASSSSLATNHGRNKPFVRWIEVDHAAVLHEKAATIQANASTTAVAGNDDNDDGSALFHGVSVKCGKTKDDPIEILQTVTAKQQQQQQFSSTCHFVPHDLRQDPTQLIDKLLLSSSSSSSELLLDANIPTLFVSECVLMYLPDSASKKLLNALSSRFSQAVCCLYEPILGQDTFGWMMQDNLMKAGVARNDSCLVKTRSLTMHLDKLSKAGWKQGIGCDLYEAYERSILTAQDRLKANQCEFLDELEEFSLIMRHYCLIVACTEASRVGQILCRSSSSSSPLGFSMGRFEEMSS